MIFLKSKKIILETIDYTIITITIILLATNNDYNKYYVCICIIYSS